MSGRRLIPAWAVTDEFSVEVRPGGRSRRRQRLRGGRGAGEHAGRLPGAVGAAMLALLAVGGCANPAVRPQRLVAKPNMTFSDSAVLTYNAPRLLPQIGPGFPGGDASQNSGCSSCR
jgi:hypothetical protein